MTPLTAFGLISVSAMLACYALEERSHWFVLAFVGACGFASIYGFLAGTWPFGLVEAIWGVIAFLRWRRRKFAGNIAGGTKEMGSS